MLEVEGHTATVSGWRRRIQRATGSLTPGRYSCASPLLAALVWRRLCPGSCSLARVPPILRLKLLQCWTLPVNISETRQTTLLSCTPSVFLGIEPRALAVPSTLTSPAKDYGAGAGGDTDPPLTATHPTAPRTDEARCLHPGEGPHRAG